LLLPPPVLDLVRPRRALARGRDPAGRRAALLLGLGLPAPRPSARVREGAGRAGRAPAAVRALAAPRRQRARGLRPPAAAAGGRRPGGVTTGPVALTIAGSDPSGGAGIQAEPRTFAAFGVPGAGGGAAPTAPGTPRVRATA